MCGSARCRRPGLGRVARSHRLASLSLREEDDFFRRTLRMRMDALLCQNPRMHWLPYALAKKDLLGGVAPMSRGPGSARRSLLDTLGSARARFDFAELARAVLGERDVVRARVPTGLSNSFFGRAGGSHR